MVVVKVKVKVGSALLGATAKPFDSTVTVKFVMDKILNMYQDLRLQRVDIYKTDAETDRTTLDLEDLLDLELNQVQPFGLFFVAACGYNNANSTTPSTGPGGRSTTPAAGEPTPLASAFEKIMAAAPLVLPTRSPAGRFDFDIFNALLEELSDLGLGWQDAADAEGSGKLLLTAMKKALQYILPFDIRGVLERHAKIIPDRWTAETLKVP